MSTATKSRRQGKPPQPVKGSCRWVRKLVLGTGGTGRLSITSLTQRGPVVTEYEVAEHYDERGRTVGYRLTKDDGTTHDVDRDLWECDCPDYLSRAAARAEAILAAAPGTDPEAVRLEAACKHVKSLMRALPLCSVLV